MPDSLISEETPSDFSPDQSEQELDDAWLKVLKDFSNENLHREILRLASEFQLFDRLARHYRNYLSQNPGDGTALKFQSEIIRLTALTFLPRATGDRRSESGLRMFRFVFFLVIFLMFVCGIFAWAYLALLQTNRVEDNYQQGLSLMLRGKLQQAREVFAKIEQTHPGYRDVRTKLSMLQPPAPTQAAPNSSPVATPDISDDDGSKR